MAEFTTAKDRDDRIIAEATHFTIVCFRGVGRYDRAQRKTLKGARKLAAKLVKQTGRNYIIYAIDGRGYQAFVETQMKVPKK